MNTLVQELLTLPANLDRPQPLLEKTFLPAAVYTDPRLLPIELEQVLQRTWQYVGEAATLAEPETVLTTTIAGLSILITRHADGALRAFHNVCPHRASPLKTEAGIDRCKQLVCPYHAWAYDLNGELVGTPGKSRFPDGFQLQDFPLKSVRLEEWEGFLFVCFDDSAPSLREYLHPIPATMQGYRSSSTRLLVKQQYTIACNWKNFHDNTLCDYHVAIAHPQTLHPLQGPVKGYQHEFWDYVNLLYTELPDWWFQTNKVLEHLPERNRKGFYTYGIFPNLHFVAMPNSLMGWIRIDPITVDSCQVRIDIFGIPEMTPPVEQLDRDFSATTQEDVALTEGVQKGYASGIYQPGVANALEERIIHQQNILRRYYS